MLFDRIVNGMPVECDSKGFRPKHEPVEWLGGSWYMGSKWFTAMLHCRTANNRAIDRIGKLWKTETLSNGCVVSLPGILKLEAALGAAGVVTVRYYPCAKRN